MLTHSCRLTERSISIWIIKSGRCCRAWRDVADAAATMTASELELALAWASASARDSKCHLKCWTPWWRLCRRRRRRCVKVVSWRCQSYEQWFVNLERQGCLHSRPWMTSLKIGGIENTHHKGSITVRLTWLFCLDSATVLKASCKQQLLQSVAVKIDFFQLFATI